VFLLYRKCQTRRGKSQTKGDYKVMFTFFEMWKEFIGENYQISVIL